MKLMCKNMTHAMKANKLLYNNGIYSKVEKLNSNSKVIGCVYSIVFENRYIDDVLRILHDGGVMLHKNEQVKFGDK